MMYYVKIINANITVTSIGNDSFKYRTSKVILLSVNVHVTTSSDTLLKSN